MKKIVYTIIFTLLLSLNVHAQTSYGNFETLNTDSTLRYWTLCLQTVAIDTSSIPDSIIVTGPLIQYSTNAHSGNYALQLQNHWNYTDNVPYMHGCAFLNLDTTHIMYNGIRLVELNNRPTSFNLYYLFPQNTYQDTSLVTVKLYDSTSAPIGEGEIKLWQLNSSYQMASTPITYTSTDSVAFYSIDITLNANHFGNKLLVDDFGFDFSPLQIKNVSAENDITIYPNPASSMLDVRCSSKVDKIEIYNIVGTLIKQYATQQTINVAELPNGVYFLKVFSKNSYSTKKFTILK